jgi:hypothetical protein
MLIERRLRDQPEQRPELPYRGLRPMLGQDVLLKRLLRPLSQDFVGLLARTGIVEPLLRLVTADVRELDESGSPGPLSSGDGRLTALALSPDQFRGDLEALAARPEMRVLRMPLRWQTRLLYSFYEVGTKSPQVHRPPHGSKAARSQAAYRKFLRVFLPRFYRRLGIDIVIGANIKYREDFDWGAISQQLGKPYVVLHRENMPITSGISSLVTKRYRKLGRFQGSCIIVHNAVTRQTFVDADYVEPERIFDLGCLRMDGFLRRIGSPRVRRSRPLVTLFSFSSVNEDIFGAGGYYPVFRDTHGAIALLAKQHPEIDVVIKPKPSMFNNPRWRCALSEALRHWGLNPDAPPANLSVVPTRDAQQLILESSVVVALNSTVLLEAAIAGLPVIMPYFKDLREGPQGQGVMFREYTDLFDVPDRGEDLKQAVMERLRHPEIGDDVMNKRRELFAALISSLDGDATSRYVHLLTRTVASSRAETLAQGVP